jgi:hypothetical protein
MLLGSAAKSKGGGNLQPAAANALKRREDEASFQHPVVLKEICYGDLNAAQGGLR